MRSLGIIVLVALSTACSGGQQAQGKQPKMPQCLSLCGNQFAACTEEFPGDFTACQSSRSDCERQCEGDRAIERMESGDSRLEVVEPLQPADAAVPEGADAGSDR